MIGVRRGRRVGLLRRYGLPMRDFRDCKSLFADRSLPDEGSRMDESASNETSTSRDVCVNVSVRAGGPGNEEMLRGQGRASGKGTASVCDSESE